LAIAKRLARDGAKVMISSRKEKNVQKALENLKTKEGIPSDQIKGLVCHVGNKDDRTKLIQQTIKDFGGIDILVSNAA
jgi:dehydrogenase/reductase SDR family protein 4